MNCLICKEPLSDGEIQLNRTWHFACQKCQFCNEPMPAPDRIAELIAAGLPVSHDRCRAIQAHTDLKNKRLPFTTEMLESLNNDLVSTYKALAHPDSTDINVLHQFLTKLKEVAVNVNWALSEVNAKVRIAEGTNYNNQIEEKTRLKREAKHAEQVETLARQEKQERLKAERDNPKLRTERKAIEHIMKLLNLNEDQAKKYLGIGGSVQ